MTGEKIRDLIEPLVGKTGVEIRPDGLVRLERETGWAVLDPAEIVAVVWNGEVESSPGQFL